MISASRRIFIHVGCPKTGTTFLQSTLWQSRDALKSRGVELPVDRLSHFHLALAVRGQLNPEIDPEHAFTVMDRFAEALADSTAPTMLVLNENLASATADQAAGLHNLIKAAGEAEVHLVITARDLGRQLPAAWQQMIQQRRTMGWDKFLRSMREGTGQTAHFLRGHDVADIARRWGSDLPPHHVHIVTLPPPSSPRQLLLERFCRVVGIDLEAVSGAAPVPNESLGRVQAELLRRVNVSLGERLPHSRAGFGRVGKRYFAQEVLAPMGGERPRLPPDMDPWCQERTKQIIATIEAQGYDVAGDLDDLWPVPAVSAPPAVTDGEIAVTAVDALADLLEQRHHDIELIDALRERPHASPTRRHRIRRKVRRLRRRIRRR